MAPIGSGKPITHNIVTNETLNFKIIQLIYNQLGVTTTFLAFFCCLYSLGLTPLLPKQN